MSIFEIFVCVLVPCCAGLLGWAFGLRRRVQVLEELCDRRDATVRNALANLAERVAKTAEYTDTFASQVQELGKTVSAVKDTVDDLPAEELKDEFKRMAAWNDGVQNILNFGPNVPKLNKGGVENE